MISSIGNGARSASSTEKVVVYAPYDHGHRRMYINVMREHLGGIALVKAPSFSIITTLINEKRGVVFVTIEDSIIVYTLCAIARALLSRVTIGLSLEVKKEKVKLLSNRWLKEMVLQLLKRSKKITTLSIVPFDLNIEGKKICKNWIYDPAFWDLNGQKPPAGFIDSIDGEIRIAIKGKGGKRVILYLGFLDKRKGFDFLVRMMVEASELCEQYVFIAAGPADKGLELELLKVFKRQNGLLINRMLTEEEVMWLQSCADVFWACYPPAFDQSSGICGRAIQLGKDVIVRKESVVDQLLQGFSYPRIASRFDDVAELSEMLMGITRNDASARTSTSKCLQEKFLIHSMTVFKQALLGASSRII